jgi:hypothetical protein
VSELGAEDSIWTYKKEEVVGGLKKKCADYVTPLRQIREQVIN